MKFDPKKINLLCKYHRTFNGYSRADIVRMTDNDITEKTILHYEQVGNYVPFNYICALADIVGITVQNFVGPDGYDSRLDYIDEYKLNNKINKSKPTPAAPGLHCVNNLTDTELRILNILRLLPKNVVAAIEILLSYIHELLNKKSKSSKK